MDKNILNNIREKYKDKYIFHYQEWKHDSSLYIIGKEGECMVRMSRYPKDDMIYISDLYVDPDYRKKYIATDLIRVCEDVSRLFNISKITIDAYFGDWTDDWYKNLGYKTDPNEKFEEYDCLFKIIN